MSFSQIFLFCFFLLQWKSFFFVHLKSLVLTPWKPWMVWFGFCLFSLNLKSWTSVFSVGKFFFTFHFFFTNVVNLTCFFKHVRWTVTFSQICAPVIERALTTRWRLVGGCCCSRWWKRCHVSQLLLLLQKEVRASDEACEGFMIQMLVVSLESLTHSHKKTHMYTQAHTPTHWFLHHTHCLSLSSSFLMYKII